MTFIPPEASEQFMSKLLEKVLRMELNLHDSLRRNISTHQDRNGHTNGNKRTSNRVSRNEWCVCVCHQEGWLRNVSDDPCNRSRITPISRFDRNGEFHPVMLQFTVLARKTRKIR